MLTTVTHDFFPCNTRMMPFQFSLNFKSVLNDFLIAKLNQSSLIGVVNTAPLIKTLILVALFIVFLLPTLTNKMVPSNVNIVILLKLALPYYLMPVFLFVFGKMLFKLPVISLIVFPLHSFKIFLLLKNYFTLTLSTLFSKLLVVLVGQIFAPIIPINFNPDPLPVSF